MPEGIAVLLVILVLLIILDKHLMRCDLFCAPRWHVLLGNLMGVVSLGKNSPTSIWHFNSIAVMTLKPLINPTSWSSYYPPRVINQVLTPLSQSRICSKLKVP
jgi:hypothetical protein